MLHLEHQIISASRGHHRDLAIAYADPIPNLEQRGLDGFFVVADAGWYGRLDGLPAPEETMFAWCNATRKSGR